MSRALQLSRRDLLGLAALGALGATGLTACGDTVNAGGAGASRVAVTHSDVALLTRVIGQERDLLVLTRLAQREERGLSDVLGRVAREQRRHVDVLSNSLTEPPDLPPISMKPLPGKTAGVLPAVTAAFSAAGDKRLADCLDATSGLLARLLASVSASHAVTVETLRAAR